MPGKRNGQAVPGRVGAVLQAKLGDRVEWGQPLVELHYRDSARFAEAQELVLNAIKIVNKQPATHKLVLEVIQRYPSVDMLKLAINATKLPDSKDDAVAVAKAISQKVKTDETKQLMSKAGLDK